jgi:hypothetical protein
MSLKTPSCTTNRIDSDRQWEEIKSKFTQSQSNPLPNEPTDRIKQAKIISPLEAAKIIKSEYIETLHIGLVTFLGDLTDDMLHHYANYFLRNVLYQESSLNADYVPTAIKKIGLTLQSLEEVKDSKDYKAVLNRYIADEEATKLRWTEYVNEVDNLTRLGLKQRFLASFCKLLNSAARGFTAEIGTYPSYTEHEVVIDLLAINPTLLLDKPFNWTAEEFLTLYKKTNDLAYLPTPTDEHILEEIILKVNNLRRKEPTTIVIDGDNPASNTTATTTTAATTPPPNTPRYIDDEAP